jgi:hypothetical protein
VDISSKGKPTTQVGTTKKGGPRKEKEEAAAGHHYFSWSNRGVFIGGRNELNTKTTAPAQTYIVSIAEGERVSTSKRPKVNPEVFGGYGDERRRHLTRFSFVGEHRSNTLSVRRGCVLRAFLSILMVEYH